MQKIIKWSALLLFAALCNACGNGNPRTSGGNLPNNKNAAFQNIIVLLDLSNRIEQSGQIDKDQNIIKEVLDVFQDNQRKFGFIASKDKLRIAIAPEPNVQAVADDRLLIDMSTTVIGAKDKAKGKPAFDKMRSEFETELANLYERAATNPNTGADIYTFFCTDLPAKYLGEPEKKTKIIILTDGYLCFDRRYERKRPKHTYMEERHLEGQRKAKDPEAYYKRYKLALTPCSRNLDSVEVMMIEIAPRFSGESVNEFNIVSRYWTDWFEAMGITHNIYPQEQQLGAIKGFIKSFLEREEH